MIFPAIPECTGETLTKNLMKQIEPFNTNFHLNERVEQLVKEGNKWKITTNKKKIFIATLYNYSWWCWFF